MSNNPTFTIHIEPAPGGGLQVTVPEIGAVIQLASTSRTEAIDAAHNAIIAYMLKQREREAARAS